MTMALKKGSPMRIGPREFHARPLRVHTLLHDVPLEDAWAIPLSSGGAGRTIQDLRAVLVAGREAGRHRALPPSGRLSGRHSKSAECVGRTLWRIERCREQADTIAGVTVDP